MRTLPHDVLSLVHWVELSKAGWHEKLAERCILAVLWLLQEPASVQKIKRDISKKMHRDMKVQELKNGLQKLEEAGEVLKLPDNRYKLSVETLKRTKEQVESFDTVERSTREKFSAGIRLICPERDPSQIWQSFIDQFLVPLVDNEGARAYELLVGKSKSKFADVASYVDAFLERIPTSRREKAASFVRHFIYSNDEETARFFLSYLDAYFILSVSGLPSRVINNLAAMGKDSLGFVIFVDTNFVYSILELHDNPSNEAANDLMELARIISNDVRIEFVIKPSTLAETQQSITHHRKRLEKATYPPNVAQAAATAVEISGVYRTFFDRVSSSSHRISAADYFAPYESNLVRMLNGKGVTVFPDKTRQIEYEQTLDVIEDIDNQLEYERKRYEERAKSEQQVIHDVVLWHFVQDQREPALNAPLEAKYWVVTVDYRFLSFDRFKTSNSNLLPVCIHPSQLIQILRFFVPRSSQFERTLLGVVKFPVFSRELNTEAERISIRIVQTLARYEGIEDIDVDVLRRVFADDALRHCLSSPVSEEEETDAVHDALTRQIAEQGSTIREQAGQVSELKTRVDKLEAETVQHRKKEQAQELAKARIEAEKRQSEEQVGALEDRLRDAETRLERYNCIWRLSLGLLITILGIIIVLALPQIWPWLSQHPNLRALQFGAIICIAAISWGITDKNKERRTIAVIPLIIGALLTIAQVLQR